MNLPMYRKLRSTERGGGGGGGRGINLPVMLKNDVDPSLKIMGNEYDHAPLHHDIFTIPDKAYQHQLN